jgi:hypothetical protein
VTPFPKKSGSYEHWPIYYLTFGEWGGGDEFKENLNIQRGYPVSQVKWWLFQNIPYFWPPLLRARNRERLSCAVLLGYLPAGYQII